MSASGTLDTDDAGQDDGESLAGEYALGLLTGETLLAARGRLGNDPAFAREVADWDAHLAPLFDAIAPVPPPPHVWQAIATELQAWSPDAHARAGGEVVRLKRQVRRWQLGTGLAAALAGVLAIVGLQPSHIAPAPPPSIATAPAPLIAALAPKGGGTISVVYRPGEGRLLARAGDLPRRAGHDLELWVLPNGGAPLPLGLVPSDHDRALAVSPAITARLAPGATLAVSLEPVGGSPTGLPTGPVLATAKISTT